MVENFLQVVLTTPFLIFFIRIFVALLLCHGKFMDCKQWFNASNFYTCSVRLGLDLRWVSSYNCI